MINNRREFLTLAGYTFLFSAFPNLAQSKINKRILILVELQGANDGLNTVIPLKQDYYYRLRPTIGIEKNKILSRLKKRGAYNKKLLKYLRENQIMLSKKRKLANYIVDNNFSQNIMKKNINLLKNKILNERSNS